MADHYIQNKYLFGLMQRRNVCRRRTKATSGGTYKSFHYHVRLGDGFTVTVGKKTFCDIHAVGKRRVEGLCCKLGTGELLYRDGPGVASFVVYLRES